MYDTLQEGTSPLQIAVYLLDLPLPVTTDGHKFATAHFPIVPARRTPENQNWTFLRSLKYFFPGLIYLQDLLPDASTSVVFNHTLLPIHTVVAARTTKGGKSELLVQFAKDITRTAHGSSRSSYPAPTWRTSGNGWSPTDHPPQRMTSKIPQGKWPGRHRESPADSLG